MGNRIWRIQPDGNALGNRHGFQRTQEAILWQEETFFPQTTIRKTPGMQICQAPIFSKAWPL
jgi:hypothetical protein